MTEQARMRAIEMRVRRATSGPWFATLDGSVRRGNITIVSGIARDPFDGLTQEDNADFIANARDDVPWLIDRVRYLEQAVADQRRTAALLGEAECAS